MNTGGSPKKDNRNQSLGDLARWLVLIPLVLLILYSCGLLARIGMAYPLATDVFSNLQADYAPWGYIVLPPVSTAMLTDIYQGTDIPGGVIITGDFWPSPTPSTLTPGYTFTSTALPSYTPSSTSRPPSPSPTQTATSTATHTPTRTMTYIYYPPTRTFTPRPTNTEAPTFVPSATHTSTPTVQPTLTITPTESYTPLPTATHTTTPTSTDTPTPTPTDTETPTPVITPTPTDTPTNTPTPTSTPPLCGGNIPPGEPNIGSPNGIFAAIPCNTSILIDLVALGYNPIDLTTPDPAYDLVYYEREAPPPPNNTIAFDWVQMDVSQGLGNSCVGGTWYNALNWGDGLDYNNGHLGSSYPEIDNQVIPFSALYGSLPYKTGIAIDLDASPLGIPPGYYPCIRIYSPINWPDNDGSEVDALEILP